MKENKKSLGFNSYSSQKIIHNPSRDYEVLTSLSTKSKNSIPPRRREKHNITKVMIKKIIQNQHFYENGIQLNCNKNFLAGLLKGNLCV